MQTIKAPALRPGDTIGIFSSSLPGAYNQEKQLRYAEELFAGHGFRLQYGSLAQKKEFYRSGGIQARAEEFNALLRDPDVKCLLASAGGYVSNSILSYIDYEALRKNPKPIVGFSDITAILLGIYAKTGLAGFYGPVLSDFWRKPPFPQESFAWLLDMLCGAPLPYVFPTPERWTEDTIDFNERYKYKTHENALVTVRGGRARGRLIACNMHSLGGIWGSEYMPEILPGDILLLEDTKTCAETAEHEFSHLKLCGVFDRIGGLLLGKCLAWNDRGSGRMFYDIFTEVAGWELGGGSAFFWEV